MLGPALKASAIRSTSTTRVPHLLCDGQTDCSSCFIQRASCWDPLVGDQWRGEDDWAGCINFPCIRKGQPKTGAELAMDLERIAENLGGATLAAVFIEPVAGSTGTLVPPEGYLQKVREICDKHGMLLVFDEVITGFGRMGTPFATQKFDVKPDIITMAKAITNGALSLIHI